MGGDIEDEIERENTQCRYGINLSCCTPTSAVGRSCWGWASPAELCSSFDHGATGSERAASTQVYPSYPHDICFYHMKNRPSDTAAATIHFGKDAAAVSTYSMHVLDLQPSTSTRFRYYSASRDDLHSFTRFRSFIIII